MRDDAAAIAGQAPTPNRSAGRDASSGGAAGEVGGLGEPGQAGGEHDDGPGVAGRADRRSRAVAA